MKPLKIGITGVRSIVGETPGAVVINLSTSSVMDDVARMFNCPLHRSKIGKANVTEMMQQVGAVIGGEGNGGVIYPRINFCRDSQVGMALVLRLLAETGRTVTDLLSDLPRYKMIKEKLECPSHKIGEVLKMVRREYAAHQQDLRDGVKVSFENGWLTVRGSNTEPIIRLVAEAEDEAQARQILDAVFERVALVLK